MLSLFLSLTQLPNLIQSPKQKGIISTEIDGNDEQNPQKDRSFASQLMVLMAASV